MKKNKIIAGNWKMNGGLSNNIALLEALKEKVQGANNEIIIIPPFVYIPQVAELLKGSAIKLGAQNISHEEKGAFTGEISGGMLKEFGCDYVLVGHSERRHLYNESNLDVAKKFLAAKNAALTPILCVGETLDERNLDQTKEVVNEQIKTVIDLVGIKAFENTIIAYEPVWAIGTGLTATPEQAKEVHEFIYYTLFTNDANISRSVKVLYGGSVKSDSAKGLFKMDSIDGALVGGASLDSEEFAQIILAN